MDSSMQQTGVDPWLAVAMGVLLLLVGASLGWIAGRSRGGVELATARERERAMHQRSTRAEEELDRARTELDGVRAESRERAALQADRAASLGPLRASLERVEKQVTALERDRVEQFGEVGERLLAVAASTQRLDASTASLAGSLAASGVRGTWGETQLRRLVEHAGMVRQVDFDEQVRAVSDHERSVRPDMVVRLPQDRVVVLDAKAPMTAFLAAQEAADGDRPQLLARHAKALRQHVEALAGKAYWSAFTRSPQFVVCFVPTDATLAAALQQDPALFDDALRRNVVLASPSTTMALLRTVAITWQHDTVERNAEEVLLLGRQLHERLATTAGHLDQMGRQLTRTVESYNQLVGGLESRVLVSARRFTDLGLPGEELPHAPGVTAAARPLTAPELTARADRPNE
ncbi:DNA recombination protein RmuC [Kytococcus sedentarius]|uniref:DNA recombination protein RmuC n=1 Tax=Kytococcus sedentarius TaxID=1276 RepID=UPI003879D3A0